MDEPDDGGRAILRAVAVAAVALAGLALLAHPARHAPRRRRCSTRAGGSCASFDARPAPDDIIIVGIDPATVNAIPEPPGLWHEPLAARWRASPPRSPRAIALDFPLPERSYDGVQPGLDRALFAGLATRGRGRPVRRRRSPSTRARARRARIHTPFLALLGESAAGHRTARARRRSRDAPLLARDSHRGRRLSRRSRGGCAGR